MRPRRRTTSAFDYLPAITGDHSHMNTVADMADGDGKRLFRDGREPGSRNGERAAAAERTAGAGLAGGPRFPADGDGGVLARGSGNCSAARSAPKTSARKSSSSRPRRIPRKDGSFTNTQRLLQWHHKAIDRRAIAAASSTSSSSWDSGLKRLYAGSTDPKDRPILD